jgi:hypothetical protein
MDGRELLKRYDAYKQEAHFLRDQNRFLRGERDHYRREWFFTQQRLNKTQESNRELRAENKLLKRRLADLTAKLKAKPKPAPPAFVGRIWVNSVHRTLCLMYGVDPDRLLTPIGWAAFGVRPHSGSTPDIVHHLPRTATYIILRAQLRP